VLVPAIEPWHIAVLGHGAGDVAVAVGATAAYLPLHLRQVHHGLHGRRPRAAVATLTLMAAVMVAAWWLIGQAVPPRPAATTRFLTAWVDDQRQRRDRPQTRNILCSQRAARPRNHEPHHG
jgi:hypothetical protein